MEEGAVIVDMRNHYESEIVILRELFVRSLKLLGGIARGKRDARRQRGEKVLLYCTEESVAKKLRLI